MRLSHREEMGNGEAERAAAFGSMPENVNPIPGLRPFPPLPRRDKGWGEGENPRMTGAHELPKGPLTLSLPRAGARGSTTGGVHGGRGGLFAAAGKKVVLGSVHPSLAAGARSWAAAVGLCPRM